MSNLFPIDDKLKKALDREYAIKNRIRRLNLMSRDQYYFTYGEELETLRMATVTAPPINTLDNYYLRGDGPPEPTP